MPTQAGSGTQTAIIGTEHTLFDSSFNKTYAGYIDLANMASGDTTEIRVKIKVNSGTLGVWHVDTYTDAQTSPILYLSPLPSNSQYRLTLKQTVGTGRSYDWKIYEYD